MNQYYGQKKKIIAPKTVILRKKKLKSRFTQNGIFAHSKSIFSFIFRSIHMKFGIQALGVMTFKLMGQFFKFQTRKEVIQDFVKI